MEWGWVSAPSPLWLLCWVAGCSATAQLYTAALKRQNCRRVVLVGGHVEKIEVGMGECGEIP